MIQARSEGVSPTVNKGLVAKMEECKMMRLLEYEKSKKESRDGLSAY